MTIAHITRMPIEEWLVPLAIADTCVVALRRHSASGCG
jgi:hypothetical protein